MSPEPAITPRLVSVARAEDDPDVIRLWAEEYVATGDAQAACRRVRWFDTRYSLAVWARRLLERQDVQMEVMLARASGITERRVEEHSREAVVQDLDEIREGAVQDGAWSAATGAVTTKARVLGYMESSVTLHVKDARELPLDVLRRMVAEFAQPVLPAPVDAEFTEVSDGAQ